MKNNNFLPKFYNSAAAKLITSTVLAIGDLLGFTPCVEGAPIYSQITPTEPVGAFSSQDTPTGQKVADNFLLTGSEPITVRSLRFIGGYASTPPPITPPVNALPPDNFRIVFLEDAAGIPGAPVAGGDFLISSAFSRTPTNGQLLNGILNPIEFIINLGNGISLIPEVEYWVSITNDVGLDHAWAWARADGVFDETTAGTDGDIAIGPWDVFVNGGMFFELNDQTVPEPTSFAILLLAALLCISIRSRGSLMEHFSD